MTELEIILPIHPAIPSIWEVVGWCLAAGLVNVGVLIGMFWWLSEPISEQEVQRVLRKG